MASDGRFAKFATDPKFRPVPKNERKVKIDPRFKSMFNDRRFDTKVFVDKRGRPKNYSSSQDYREFYSLEDEDSSDDSGDEAGSSRAVTAKSIRKAVDDKQKGPKKDKGLLGTRGSGSAEARPPGPGVKVGKADLGGEGPASSSKKLDKLRDLSVDYARGEGVLDSSSDSDSSDEGTSSEDEEGPSAASESDKDEGFDKWGELDHDAKRHEDHRGNEDQGDKVVSRRLAVCNLDWDRVGAEDIYVALASFCPADSGRLESVRIFLSDFGRKRLADEELHGPEELRGQETGEANQEEDLLDDDPDEGASHQDEDEENEKKAMERVRKYQVNRLKYYYAVAEFSSPGAANQVYEACDGHEYELSATRFDLRFVPDDMTFDDCGDPTDACHRLPDPEKYRPKVFFNTALMQGKVNLTWDETDPDRRSAMLKAFEAAGDDDDDSGRQAKAFLACSSDESDGGQDEEDEDDHLDGGDEDEDEEATLAKYKALLSDSGKGQKGRKSAKDKDMEFTWTVSSSKSTGGKEAASGSQTLTPWEQFLQKKRDKQKQKRLKRSAKKSGGDDDDIGEKGTDDGGDDAGFDDPFFDDDGQDFPEFSDDDEVAAGRKKATKAVAKKNPKKGAGDAKNDDDDAAAGGLALLAFDGEATAGRDHFDYKEIVKVEAKDGGKNKKGKKRRADHRPEELQEQEQQRDFQMDLADERFSAVFKRAEFNVDPSHPAFKKTRSMQQIIDEKQKRLRGQQVDDAGDSSGLYVRKRSPQYVRADNDSSARGPRTPAEGGSGDQTIAEDNGVGKLVAAIKSKAKLDLKKDKKAMKNGRFR